MGRWFAGLKEKKFMANKMSGVRPDPDPHPGKSAPSAGFASMSLWNGTEGNGDEFHIVYFASPDPLTGVVRDTPYTPSTCAGRCQ